MPTPFFGLNIIDGTQPQAKLYNGTQISPVGVAFGALEVFTVIERGGAHANNRVIQFGNNTIYALAVNTVYRSTNGGASWTSVYTLSYLAGIQTNKTGIFLPYINGIPHLALFWKNTAGSDSVMGAISSNGTTWTTYGPVVISGANISSGWGPNYMYRNKLFTVRSSSNQFGGLPLLFSFDPGAGTFTLVTTSSVLSSTQAGGYTFGEFNGNLMLLFADSGATARLAVLSGGNFGNVVSFGAITGGVGNQYGMFADGSNLYCFIWTSAAAGWKCWEVSASYVATDISTTVIPVGLTGTTGGGNTSFSGRVWPMVDQEASPGANPNKYIYFSDNFTGVSDWTVFQWQGSGSVMTQLDTGGGVSSQALSVVTYSQGSYFWSSDANSIELTNRTPLANALRLYFVVFSPSGTATVDVRAWRASALEEYPITAATLTDPSSGSMSGNTITGLIADNVTVYQVTWQTATDGFAAGDPYSLILEVLD
jgi:hypothetical protein